MTAKRVLLVCAIVAFTFKAFAFAPFGNFDFGWAGLVLVAGALL